MNGAVNIAVFSDTHGNRQAIEEAVLFSVERYGIGRVVHLGDGVGDGEAAAERFGIPFDGVAGNEDFSAAFPDHRVIEEGMWRILCFHGHQYDINPYQSDGEWESHYADMGRWAERAGASVALFGHTHRQALLKRGGLIFCNPGDMYRGSVGPPGFALLQVPGAAVTVTLMERQGEMSWAALREESLVFSETAPVRAERE